MAVRSGRVDREGCPLVPRLGLSLWRAPHPGSTTRTSCCSAFPSHWGETGRTEGAEVFRYHPPLRRLTCHRAEGDPSSLTPAAALGRPFLPRQVSRKDRVLGACLTPDVFPPALGECRDVSMAFTSGAQWGFWRKTRVSLESPLRLGFRELFSLR